MKHNLEELSLLKIMLSCTQNPCRASRAMGWRWSLFM